MCKNIYRAISFWLIACLFLTSVNIEAYASSLFVQNNSENNVDDGSISFPNNDIGASKDNTYTVSTEN